MRWKNREGRNVRSRQTDSDLQLLITISLYRPFAGSKMILRRASFRKNSLIMTSPTSLSSMICSPHRQDRRYDIRSSRFIDRRILKAVSAEGRSLNCNWTLEHLMTWRGFSSSSALAPSVIQMTFEKITSHWLLPRPILVSWSTFSN